MFLHYTSRENAERILADGWIRPGRQRKLYLTKDLYDEGAIANDILAIIGQETQVVFLIPEDRVHDPHPQGGRHVERIILEETVIRQGCGTEWYTEHEVDVRDLERRELR